MCLMGVEEVIILKRVVSLPDKVIIQNKHKKSKQYLVISDVLKQN